MLSIEYKNKLAMEISGNPEPFFARLLPEVTIEQSGDTNRLQPCPKCGHRDCCNLTQGSPLVNCFHPECEFKGNSVDALLRIPGVTEEQISSIAFEIFGLDIPDDRENRLERIREIGIEHYHAELMSSSEQLRHQIKVRKHKDETLRMFKIGLAMNYPILHRSLLEEGFKMEEIKEAKIWIPEGLFVYPYFDWKTGKITRINTKGIADKNGLKPDGHYSWGEKVFYTSPSISKTGVLLSEGEDDFLSIWEAGEHSVIASGGNLSSDQLQKLPDLVDGCDKVFNMFDNDEAGAAYDEKVVAAIAHKKVFKVNYVGKDPDDLLKRSETSVSIDELIQSATLIPCDGYHIDHKGHRWKLATRELSIVVTVKRRTNTGAFYGDVEVQQDGKGKDEQINILISKYRLKDSPVQYALAINNKLEEFYDGRVEGMDLQGLLEAMEFSNNDHQFITKLGRCIHETGDIDEGMKAITKARGTKIKDQVLLEINGLQNANWDPDEEITRMKISQFFDPKNGVAFMYFNKEVNEDGGVSRIPCLVSNQKKIIQLDQFKKKTPQSVLLINQKYELPFEVQVAIGRADETSLRQRLVERYIGDEIDARELNPALVVRRLESQIRRFYYSADDRFYKVIALWLYGTYLFDLFDSYPYLFFNGKKGTGKTTIDSIIRSYAFNAKHSVQITASALFRTVDAEGCTLILDEVENLTSRTKTGDSDLATVIKAGYSKSSGRVYRTNSDKGFSIECFEVYCPKVISNIYGLEDVIGDRCLEIKTPVVRKAELVHLESVESYWRDNMGEIRELTSLCCLSALENFQVVFERYNSTTAEGETARSAQIMKALTAIASLAGPSFETAFSSFYKDNILVSKQDLDNSTPEEAIKFILEDNAKELCGMENLGLSKVADGLINSDRGKVTRIEEGFEASNLYLKIGLDSVLPGVKHPLGQIIRYLNQSSVKYTKASVPRTTVQVLSDTPLARELGSSNPTCNRYQFKFDDFECLGDWRQALKDLELKKQPVKELGFEDF